jgi:hypothetical protein
MLALLLLLAAPATDTTYWQQRVAYEITASLAESTGVLTGRARIRYHNQSPDTLRDFSVHQYLNAFRPGSRWAQADSAEQRIRFQYLQDPHYAFERITASTIMGEQLKPAYPFAPDSTIAHWTLPRPLPPGDSLVVEIDWQARPSTLPRRQGRFERRYDFAQWYPRVVAYDKHGWNTQPLYPAGEFYGDFGSYDVTLDLPEDQVIGATGVPVEGDPGWEKANVNRAHQINYQRDWYGPSGRRAVGPSRCGSVEAGRKCVRFYADSVHHFAFSLNPDYKYEEGRFNDVVVRVLYLPEDSTQWGGGIAVQRTVNALRWLDYLFGKFAWPQITNVHRIESGGTEFPMLVMNGGANQGLIVHEVGHNYLMGILANNEWKEAWLDEGFTSFQSAWFFEAQGQPPAYHGIASNILFWDIERWSEPVSMQSERYHDFLTYSTMVYSKGQLFLDQLRYVVGDSTMRQILRTYYARWRLKHVDEGAFLEVAEDVSRMDLDWLFGQWLHGTPLIDYRLVNVHRRLDPGGKGRWRTTVTIERLGDGWMPIEIGDEGEIYARSVGQAQIERVEFVSDHEPGRLMLDPRQRAHDWNALNNREHRPLVGSGGRMVFLDDPTREGSRRDRIVTGILPIGWYNDHGGGTYGLRLRENYLGRFEQNLAIATWSTGPSVENRLGGFIRFKNPVRRPVPRGNMSFSAWHVEGRTGASFNTDRSIREHLTYGADKRTGFDAIWMATTDLDYLDRRYWDDAGTVEGGPWFTTAFRKGGRLWRAKIGGRLGLVYRFPGIGIVSSSRYDVEPFARATGEVSVRAPFFLRSAVAVRLFAGGYLGENRPPRQRRIPLAGADPYETFTNPFVRSRGALLVRRDFHYHAPGNANLRGFSAFYGGRWAVSMNLEAVKQIWGNIALETFADIGVVDPLAIPSSPAGRWYTTLYDAGFGVLTRHTFGELGWTMRFEFPLIVNRYTYAADWDGPDNGPFAFRWQVSMEPTF